MKRFEPNWDSLKTHRVPSWYDQAKIGVLIHWGLYSVPAFAPPVGELGTIPDDEWFVANPYAEWYFNSVNVGRGPLGSIIKKRMAPASDMNSSQICGKRKTGDRIVGRLFSDVPVRDTWYSLQSIMTASACFPAATLITTP